MKLSLRLRTFSSHATVMYAKGTDYSILEVCPFVDLSSLIYSASLSTDKKLITLLIIIKSRLTVLLHFLAGRCISISEELIKHISETASHQTIQPCVLTNPDEGFKKPIFKTTFTSGTKGMLRWLKKNHTQELF